MSDACVNRHPLSHFRGSILVACVATIVVITSTARANPSGPLILTGADLINTGDPWVPDIPSAAWDPLLITVPLNNTYVATGNPVDAVSVSVVAGNTLGLTFPKNRTPDVVFSLSGAEVAMNDHLTIEWPNVHNYPVGESHLIFAYDPATDRWTVCGAATVSADGSALVQANNSYNTTLSYYFVDETVLATWPGN